MADDRDVILNFQYKYINTGINDALKDLGRLEKAIQNFNSSIAIKVTGTGGLKISSAGKEFQNVSSGMVAFNDSTEAASAIQKELGLNTALTTGKVKELRDAQLGLISANRQLVGGGITANLKENAAGQVLEPISIVNNKKQFENKQINDSLNNEENKIRQIENMWSQHYSNQEKMSDKSKNEMAKAFEQRRVEQQLPERAGSSLAFAKKQEADLLNIKKEGAINEKQLAMEVAQRNIEIDKQMMSAAQAINKQRDDMYEQAYRTRNRFRKEAVDRDVKAESDMMSAAQTINKQRDSMYAQAYKTRDRLMQESTAREAKAAEVKANASSFSTFTGGKNVRQIESQFVLGDKGKIQEVSRALDVNRGIVMSLNKETGKLSLEMTNSGDTMQNAAAKVLLWSVATGAIFGTIRAIKGSITTFAELEQGMVSLSRVGRGFTQAQMGTDQANKDIAVGAQRVTDEVLKLSVAYGQASDDAMAAAVNFARMGLTTKEVLIGTETALKAANVAGISVADASKYLTSAMSQFELSVRDLPTILDRLNTMENTTRVRTIDLLNSISRAGAVFRESGGSLEQLAATTAVVGQATGRSGAEIGNALKTIVTRLGDSNNQAKVFEKTGIRIVDGFGNLMPINKILGSLVAAYDKLGQAERNELNNIIAGSRQRNVLQAALDNYYQIQGQVTKQYETQNSAENENKLILETMAKKWEQLSAAFQRFSYNFVNSSLGSFLKKFLDVLIGVINFMTNLGTVGNVIVTIFAIYVASVVFASLQTKLFGATLLSLKVGFETANASIFRTIGMLRGYKAATTDAAIANQQLAASTASSLKVYGSAVDTASTQAGKLGIGIEKAANVSLWTRMIGFATRFAGLLAIGAAAISAAQQLGEWIGNKVNFGPQGKPTDKNAGLEVDDKKIQEDLRKSKGALDAASNNYENLLGIKSRFSDLDLTQEENGKRLQKVAKDIALWDGISYEFKQKAEKSAITLLDIEKEIAATKNKRNPLEGDVETKTRESIKKKSDILANIESELENEKEIQRRIETGKSGSFKNNDAGAVAIRKLWFSFALTDRTARISELRGQADEIKKQIESEVGNLNKQNLTIRLKPKFDNEEAIQSTREEIDVILKEVDAYKDIADMAKNISKNAIDFGGNAADRSYGKIKILKEEYAFLSREIDNTKEKLAQSFPGGLDVAKKDEDGKKMLHSIEKAQRRKLFIEQEEIPDEQRKGAAASAEENIKRIIEEEGSVLDSNMKKKEMMIEYYFREKAEVLKIVSAQEMLNEEVRQLKDMREASLKVAEMSDDMGDQAEAAASAADAEAYRLRILELEKRIKGEQLRLDEASTRQAIEQAKQREQNLESTQKTMLGMSDEELIKAKIFAGRLQQGTIGQYTEKDILSMSQPMRQQLAQYQEMFPGQQFLPKDLFNISGGNNDILTKQELNLTTNQMRASIGTLLIDSVDMQSKDQLNNTLAQRHGNLQVSVNTTAEQMEKMAQIFNVLFRNGMSELLDSTMEEVKAPFKKPVATTRNN